MSGNSNASKVWLFFKKRAKGAVQCTKCDRQWAHFSNTTNMTAHLKHNHHDAYQVVMGGKKTNPPASTTSNSQPLPFRPPSSNNARSTSSNANTTPSSSGNSRPSSSSTPVSAQNTQETENDVDDPIPIDVNNEDMTNSSDVSNVPRNAAVVPTAAIMPTTAASQRNTDDDGFVQPTLPRLLKRKASFNPGGSRAITLDQAFIIMVIKDNLPFRAGEKEGMKMFVKAATKLYTPPSARTVTRRVEDLYEHCRAVQAARLAKLQWVSITFDIVTLTNSQRSFLIVTCHFINECCSMERIVLGVLYLDSRATAVYLHEQLDNTTTNFSISKEQIVSSTVDGGSNVKLATDLFLGLQKLIECLAHLMNNVVEDGLSSDETTEIHDVLDVIKDVVRYCRQNKNVMIEIRKLEATEEGRTEGNFLLLIQDVSTRWNSTYDCLKRYGVLKTTVSSVLNSGAFPNAPPLPTPNQLAILNDVVDVLYPFKIATEDISVENKVSGSLVLPIVRMIMVSLQALKPVTPAGKKLLTVLDASVQRRLFALFSSTLLNKATICDPRFKRLHLETAHCTEAINQLNREMKAEGRALSSQATAVPEQISTAAAASLWSSHDTMARNMTTEESMYGVALLSQFRSYLNKPVELRDTDPLLYWKETAAEFPLLSSVARKYLTVMGASVSSERAASLLKQTVPDNRSRYTNAHVDMRVFLSSLDPKWLL